MGKKTVFLILSIAGFFFPIYSSVKVTQNTPQRLVFTWEPDGFDTCTLIDSGRFVSNISFGSENTVVAGEGGEVLPGQSVYAGVPPSGEVGITFTPGQVRTVHLGFPLRKFKNNDRLEPRGRLIPGTSWAVEKKLTRFRGLRAMRLVICPIRWEEASSTVQLLESAECSIEFPPIASSSRPGLGMTDYERMLKKLILNYDIASSWTVPDLHPLKKAVDPYPFDYNQPGYCFKIGDGHAGFNEMTVKENGILKIPGSQIKRLFSNDSALIGMNRVALYGSWKGSLPMEPPLTGAIPAGVTEVPLLRVDADHNGRVDDGDYFLAWVTGLSDWEFDSTRGDYHFKVDPYADNRTYRLALKPSGSGLTMEKFTQPSSPAYTVDRVRTPLCFKQSNHTLISVDSRTGLPVDVDGPGFVWVCLKSGAPEFRMVMDLPECDTGRGGTIRLMLSGLSSAFDVTVGGEPVCTGCQAGIAYPVTRWGDRSLRMAAINTSSLDCVQFDHVRVDYEQPLYAGRDTVRMQVFSTVDSQPIAYRLSGIAGKRLCILRIPDDESAISLIDTVDSANTYTWSDFGTSGVKYAVGNEAGFIHLNDEAFSVPRRTASSGFFASNLRDAGNESDYLIITQPGFFDPAKRLAEHKAKNGFGKPRIVSVDDIYLDFAGGNLDPTAIRNFLAYVRRNWVNGDKLDYVLLMGSGHYDYKQVKTGESNNIPPAEVTINYQSPGFKFGDSGIDDFYAYLGTIDSDGISVALGRLPCMNENEAEAMVDKITEIEDPLKADFGPWRNSMLLVADDDMQGTTYDVINHTGSSEKVAGCVDAERYSMNIRKAYLFDYEWNANWEKPEASRAIINEINNGVGYVNFFGHGSDVYWTDEHVLSPDIVPQLINKKHYPLISSFSCSVGKFDKPENVSLGEVLLKLPDAGAIASLAATRSTGAPNNEDLAKNVYTALFDTTANQSIGMAIISGKTRYGSNNLMYALFGDPSIRLVNQSRRVDLAAYDSLDVLRDTIKALQRVTVKGTIVDNSGNVDQSFGSVTPAFVQIGLFNAPQSTGRKDNGADTSVRYEQPGKPLFSGKTAVRNGAFEQTLLIPLDLTFNKSGVKLSAYAWEGRRSASGYRKGIIFHGGGILEGKTDSTGPRITIRPVYEVANMLSTAASFTDRICSSLPLNCEIELNDPNGINVMGTGPDEGLTIEIPGVLSRRNINHKFQFAEGDYRRGVAVVSFEEKSLEIGQYTFIITSRDLLGNVSKAAIALEITDENEPTLDRTFNTPNPVRMGRTTRFFFYPSTAQPYLNAHFMIKVFSLGGKLLRVFKNAHNGEPWDLKDQSGYPLPPNIYLYQVTAYYYTSGKQVKSKIQKLVIHPPR